MDKDLLYKWVGVSVCDNLKRKLRSDVNSSMNDQELLLWLSDHRSVLQEFLRDAICRGGHIIINEIAKVD